MLDIKCQNNHTEWQLKINKTCFISGATRGFGKLLSGSFWDAGYSLCLVARNEAALEKLELSLIPRKGQKITRLFCDLADPIMVEELINKVKSNLENHSKRPAA